MYLAEVLQEKLGNAIHQDDSRRGVRNAMATSGKGHHFGILSVLDQLVDDREGIREMDVVVTSAVRNQKFSLQLFGFFDGR